MVRRLFSASMAAFGLIALLSGAPALAQSSGSGGASGSTPAAHKDSTYTQEEIMEKARGFFGDTTEGLAKAVARVFEDKGRPNAFIIGEEASGAIGIGVRYGEGELNRKFARPLKVYWQGPSIGFDLGGNASRVFTLIYNLDKASTLFQRFPGADGSLYIVAGLSVNYLQSGNVIIAPMRTGVGLRAGASVGYLHFTRKHSWLPL